MKPQNTLPKPTEEAIEHSEKLSQHIQKSIRRHGPLTFAQYMEKALYTPGLGYYASGLPKIGQTGDFVTAPEISPIFSHCLARQAMQVLQSLPEANILEFGAGQGTMAKDIMLELEAQQQSLHRYYIVELSADLRARQQATLQAQLPAVLFEKIVWLDQLPTKPISAVILANEVLDAMPFERIRIEPEQALQGFVTFDESKNQFAWDYQKITQKPLQQFANHLIEYIGKVSDLGYETELNLNITPWLKSISTFLSQGVVLLIDYGYARTEYYQPSRVMGTLRCHYQHRAHSNPFYCPGLQDITAHVDFTAVAESAYEAGFKVTGYTTQAHFLMGSGLLEMASNHDAPITEQLKTAQQIKTLTLPNEMGETFKVIALSKALDLPLIGFKMRDLRHQL